MWRWLAIISLLLGPSIALAQDEGRRSETQAASANAVARLRDEVSATQINRHLTVGQFLDRTHSADELMKTLQQAEEIGGPRWIDSKTCQVQLEITGRRIALALTDIAAAHPKQSPIPPEEIARLQDTWGDRVFSATGSSTRASPVSLAQGFDRDRRPHDTDRWAGVSDTARQQGVADAKSDAVNEVLGSLRPVELTGGRTVGDALTDPQVRKGMIDWLQARPVTRVEFRDDLQVELALGTTSRETFDEFRTLIESNPGALPRGDVEWKRVREDFDSRMGPTVGRASVVESEKVAQQAAVVLPRHAPSWADDAIDAAGGSARGGSKLKAARAAEADARADLRKRIESLPLGRHSSLGEAAKQDPHVADAINHVVDNARVAKTEYDDHGVTVRITVDGREVWEALKGE